VQLATSAEEALDLAVRAPPDLVVLDVELPDMSGLEVCTALREWSEVPIIILSAQAEERTKVEALDRGADDYLTKPFGSEELLARVRAVLRRYAGEATVPVLESGELRLDQSRRLVTLRGCQVHLTPTEYEILRYLMANTGKVVTHRTLLRAVWGPGYEEDHSALRVFIAQLRGKIERGADRGRYIETAARVGYRFRGEA
jgi:two-component system KDP operon response regulator KdpE